MVTVSYQWIIFILVCILLAVHPTVELIVRAPNIRQRISQSQDEKEEVRNAEMDDLPYERDKPRLSIGSEVVEANLMPSPNRVKRMKKLRRKRAEGVLRSDAIIFPDQLESQIELENRQFLVPNNAAPPPCARGGGDTFCESVEEYPAEHVMRVLRKEPVVLRTFFQDERKQFTLVDDVQDRIDASDENPLCAAQEHTVYPKMAKNIEGNWLFVINHDEYVQGVRVEKCLNDRECSFPASLPYGYRSQCKQKYIYRKLVALNGTGQGVISDSFQFPSCCSCVIKLDHNIAHSRFGGSGVGAALPLTLPKTTPTPSSLRHKPKS
ncbi:protein spaetzle-like [Macrosteles quadrilineatus]|uniref:protein spaetzle-like n=1 Tax=Macrosteles quadrilineatus TaxID=74068 RepID=UPI0023E26882|nr:protein spaetzle-like [Macrosteles quadrilineatus]